jgi:hypothetical protein
MAITTDEPPVHWTDTRRSDGVFIVPAGDDRYIAIHPDGRSLHRCLCCGKPFATPLAAQRNADHRWPFT